MKKMIGMFICAALFLTFGAAGAAADSQYVESDEVYARRDGKTIYISSDHFLYNFSGDIAGVTICGYAGKKTALVIPDEINGRSVAAIDDNTLAGNADITSLTVCSNVSMIGEGAFSDCANLESVTLSGSVKVLENVFCRCPKLTQVICPEGLSEINGSFRDCTALTSVKLSRSVSKLGNGSFNGCRSLGRIEWSTGLSYLGDVFDGCNMLSRIHIPKGIVTIDGAFDNCRYAEVLELPDSLMYLNSGFNGCTALRKVDMPHDLLYIGKAFNGCTALERVKINAAAEVDTTAFTDCPALVREQNRSGDGTDGITVAIIPLAVLLIVILCIRYVGANHPDWMKRLPLARWRNAVVPAKTVRSKDSDTYDPS